MNGKFKKFSLFALLSVFILVQTSISAFADTIVPTSIPTYENPSYNVDDVKEIAVLGTLAEMLNTGSAFDFTDYNNSYSDFIDDIYSMIPESSWNSYWNKIAEQIDEEVNQIPVIGWINSVLTGRSTFYSPAQRVGNYIGTNWLFSTDDEEDTTPVNPNPDYATYINNMNDWAVFNADYNIVNVAEGYGTLMNYGVSVRKNYSYYNSFDWGFLNRYYRNYIFSYITANIVNNGSGYTVSFSLGENTSEIYPSNINKPNLSAICFFTTNYSYTNQVVFAGIYNDHSLTMINSQNFNTLADTFDYLQKHFKNINIYVDGVAWYLKPTTDAPSRIYYDDESLKYTNTDLNIKVDYPDGTYFDYNQMKQIIQEIIDNKDVLTYNDIKPVFIDHNGQQAVAVYVVNQNPTDIDIEIQYPNGTPNFDSFTESFNQISNNTSPAVYLIELVAMVVPNELWELLVFGGVLFLFVFLIKRMLE